MFAEKQKISASTQAGRGAQRSPASSGVPGPGSRTVVLCRAFPGGGPPGAAVRSRRRLRDVPGRPQRSPEQKAKAGIRPKRRLFLPGPSGLTSRKRSMPFLSATSFSISGRMLSLYFHRSAFSGTTGSPEEIAALPALPAPGIPRAAWLYLAFHLCVRENRAHGAFAAGRCGARFPAKDFRR